MTGQEFAAVLAARLEKTRRVLAAKGDEYATPADRLHNFKRSAQIRANVTPAQACVGFLLKHLTSVFDLVDGLAAGRYYDVAYIDEKVGDAVNYLILLEAILLEGKVADGK